MAGQSSQFSRLYIETAAGGGQTAPLITAMTKINGITSITGIEGGETPDVAVTDLDSVAVEVVAGVPDFGEVTLEINEINNDSGQGLLRTAWQNGELRWFALDVRLPGATASWSRRFFRGIVRSVPLSLAAGEAQTRTVNIRTSGAMSSATTVNT